MRYQTSLRFHTDRIVHAYDLRSKISAYAGYHIPQCMDHAIHALSNDIRISWQELNKVVWC